MASLNGVFAYIFSTSVKGKTVFLKIIESENDKNIFFLKFHIKLTLLLSRIQA